jgi:hypothetical protein
MFNQYTVEGNVAKLEVGRVNGTAIIARVSVNRIEELIEFNKVWSIAGKKGNQYIRSIDYNSEGKDTTFYIHRLLCKTTEEKPFVDHVNGDSFDNTDGNLRAVTRAENTFNTYSRVVHLKSPKVDFLHSYFRNHGVDLEYAMMKAGLLLNGGFIRIGDARQVIKQFAV